MDVKIKRLKPDAKLPSYAHPGDVGMDLFSCEETYSLAPGERKLFYCGFAMEFPDGYAAIVKDKSSMAKMGLHTMGGVFDAGYRGEYNVQLVNLTDTPIVIEKGQKIAQVILFPVLRPTLVEAETLSESVRGVGAFGSTGKF